MGYFTKLISVVSIPGFESKIYSVFFQKSTTLGESFLGIGFFLLVHVSAYSWYLVGTITVWDLSSGIYNNIEITT